MQIAVCLTVVYEGVGRLARKSPQKLSPHGEAIGTAVPQQPLGTAQLTGDPFSAILSTRGVAL
jgi:hypothetical protein